MERVTSTVGDGTRWIEVAGVAEICGVHSARTTALKIARIFVREELSERRRRLRLGACPGYESKESEDRWGRLRQGGRLPRSVKRFVAQSPMKLQYNSRAISGNHNTWTARERQQPQHGAAGSARWGHPFDSRRLSETRVRRLCDARMSACRDPRAAGVDDGHSCLRALPLRFRSRPAIVNPPVPLRLLFGVSAVVQLAFAFVYRPAIRIPFCDPRAAREAVMARGKGEEKVQGVWSVRGRRGRSDGGMRTGWMGRGSVDGRDVDADGSMGWRSGEALEGKDEWRRRRGPRRGCMRSRCACGGDTLLWRSKPASQSRRGTQAQAMPAYIGRNTMTARGLPSARPLHDRVCAMGRTDAHQRSRRRGAGMSMGGGRRGKESCPTAADGVEVDVGDPARRECPPGECGPVDERRRSGQGMEGRDGEETPCQLEGMRMHEQHEANGGGPGMDTEREASSHTEDDVDDAACARAHATLRRSRGVPPLPPPVAAACTPSPAGVTAAARALPSTSIYPAPRARKPSSAVLLSPSRMRRGGLHPQPALALTFEPLSDIWAHGKEEMVPMRPPSDSGGLQARARALSSSARRWAGDRGMRESEIGGSSVYRGVGARGWAGWNVDRDARDGCIGRMIKMEGRGAGERGGGELRARRTRAGMAFAVRGGMASRPTGTGRGRDCGPVDVRHPECGEPEVEDSAARAHRSSAPSFSSVRDRLFEIRPRVGLWTRDHTRSILPSGIHIRGGGMLRLASASKQAFAARGIARTYPPESRRGVSSALAARPGRLRQRYLKSADSLRPPRYAMSETDRARRLVMPIPEGRRSQALSNYSTKKNGVGSPLTFLDISWEPDRDGFP
ncbi:hypothetical protein DFH09DRAFT_1280379 [Mycena vulgaris]|nr:hypothetical protein DFH09DRAFT_1280379 [Mycena vulgaris]